MIHIIKNLPQYFKILINKNYDLYEADIIFLAVHMRSLNF